MKIGSYGSTWASVDVFRTRGGLTSATVNLHNSSPGIAGLTGSDLRNVAASLMEAATLIERNPVIPVHHCNELNCPVEGLTREEIVGLANHGAIR